MPGASIADLTVLGIASEGPIEAERIATVAKSLVPEHWQPTANVIAAVIERNLETGLLRRTGNHPMDQHLMVTAKGNEKIRALLLCPPEALAPSALPAAEAVQFCFLDTTDSETAKTVLLRFQRKLENRLSSYEQRSAAGHGTAPIEVHGSVFDRYIERNGHGQRRKSKRSGNAAMTVRLIGTQGLARLLLAEALKRRKGYVFSDRSFDQTPIKTNDTTDNGEVFHACARPVTN